MFISGKHELLGLLVEQVASVASLYVCTKGLWDHYKVVRKAFQGSPLERFFQLPSFVFPFCDIFIEQLVPR